jgi:hypothetical protein
MKFTGKLAVFFLLVALVCLPLQAAHARGLLDGPIFGENYTLKSGETLNNDLVVFGGSISIEKDARVNGAIVLFGGSLTLNGEVSKDVVVMGGAVKLGDEAHIHGNLVTMGAPVNRETGAKVDGDVVNNPTRPETPIAPALPQASTGWDANPIWKIFSVLGQSIALALLAMLIAMFLPTQMRRVADGMVAQPLVAFGIGLLTLILFIVLLVALGLFSILIITLLLTVPLIILVSVLFSIGSVLGWLAFGAEVGLRLGLAFKRDWPLPLAAGLGVFFLNLVANIPIGGGLISTLVGLAALGAVVLTRFGTRTGMLLTAPVPAAAEPPVQN